MEVEETRLTRRPPAVAAPVSKSFAATPAANVEGPTARGTGLADTHAVKRAASKSTAQAK